MGLDKLIVFISPIESFVVSTASEYVNSQSTHSLAVYIATKYGVQMHNMQQSSVTCYGSRDVVDRCSR